MKRKIFTMIIVSVMMFSVVPSFATSLDNSMASEPCIKEKAIEKKLHNIEKKDKALAKVTRNAMYSVSEDNMDYKISTESEFDKAMHKLDETDETYNADLAAIIENTDPDVYSEKLEEQAKDVVTAVEKIDELTPNELIRVKKENGDVHSFETYELDSGAEIIVEGLDEIDEEDDVKTVALPGAIKTATWVTNKNIFKSNETQKRRYTATYYLKVSGKVKGKLSVTNHYNVNANSLTMRAPNVWEYDDATPITVEPYKDPYKSSKTKLTSAGEQFYAAAQFYVTFSKKVTTTSSTTAGADVGVSISGTTGTSVEWQKNATRLHKIYAIVKLNKLTDEGAYLKQSGKVTYAE